MTHPSMPELCALLLLDPESGGFLVDGLTLDRALAGAVLLDLALSGRLVPDTGGDKMRVQPGPPPAEELLRTALTRLPDGWFRPKRRIERLVRGLRRDVLDSLEHRGAVRIERTRLLRRRRWVPLAEPRSGLVADLGAVLRDGVPPTPEQAGLVSLLHAVRRVPRVIDGDRRQLRARAEEISEQDWAGPAVRAAVQAIRAVIIGVLVSSQGAQAGQS